MTNNNTQAIKTMTLIFKTMALIFSLATIGFSQSLTPEQYKKALWMATRFFGGQRSGEGPNWLIMDHGLGKDFTLDADGDYSLAGGWHDCGDHVKYGQTQFYSGYVLLKAFAEFPKGFDDNYAANYAGYRQSGDFTWEGGKGGPNGIPDLLDEVKYATDYFLRCTRSETQFYSQVGDGNLDHKKWITSVQMATLAATDGGQPRRINKNPEDASMPSFCGAALAIMSRVYRKYDAAYADQCLVHARYAYAYAKAHPGTEGTKDGGFYPANARWQDDYVILTAELYNATGENAFLDEAKAKASNVGDHNFTLCYNNNDDLAAYNLAAVGQADKGILLQKMVARYKGNITAEGVGATGDMWGRLRFPMYQSFAAGLSSKLGGVSAVDPFVVKNIDYVLGKNSTGQSFLVGFGEKSPQHPHHRNVYLSDANGDKTVLTIPVRNKQAGIMVGGTLNPGDFKDDVEAYQFTEGCIDYNAGLVAALGYLLSVVAPVDTTHFTGVSALLNQPKKELPQNDFWMRQETPRFGIDGLGRAKPTASLFQFGFTIPYDKP